MTETDRNMLMLGLLIMGVAFVRVLADEGTLKSAVKRLFIGDPKNNAIGAVLFIGIGVWGLKDGNMLRAGLGFAIGAVEIVLTVVSYGQREASLSAEDDEVEPRP